jgi:hypothetical protein
MTQHAAPGLSPGGASPAHHAAAQPTRLTPTHPETGVT